MRKPEPTLTTQELAIMKVVWRLGHATVRDVYHALLESRHIAYTTVMTMMNVLETKGYLKKEKADRAYRLPSRPAGAHRHLVDGARIRRTGSSTARRGRCCCTSSRTAASATRSAKNCFG